jgi:hypothetical protein
MQRSVETRLPTVEHAALDPLVDPVQMLGHHTGDDERLVLTGPLGGKAGRPGAGNAG